MRSKYAAKRDVIPFRGEIVEITISKLIGLFGIALAIIEIWWPKLSVALERYIGRQISEIRDFQHFYIKEYRTISRMADGSIKEAFKGPKPVTYEQFKENTFTSVTNIRSYLWFYWISTVNFLILKPSRLLLVFLNKLGRGRAVGGLGVALAILSTFL